MKIVIEYIKIRKLYLLVNKTDSDLFLKYAYHRLFLPSAFSTNDRAPIQIDSDVITYFCGEFRSNFFNRNVCNSNSYLKGTLFHIKP